ncbi:MAG: sulfatase [Bacteroidetes bacterium]|nr:MAG: sulfatase [Bacteroidota bacterium]
MNIRRTKHIYFYLIHTILVVLIPFSISCDNAKTKSEKKEQRPNIIFIMSDDHTTQAITAYDSIYADFFTTPNIDRLASEGMRFDNVYCPNAICGPSRAAIITGKYSHRNGYYKNESGGHFNPNQWTFTEELHDQGYTTAMVGKWHLGTQPRGFDFFMYHNNWGQQGFYYNPVYNYNGEQDTIKGYCTTITTDTALAWLNKVKDGNKPFALLLHYKAPHRNWFPDSPYVNMYPDQDLPYPKTFNDDYKGREKTAGDTWMTMDYFNHKDMKLPTPEGLTGDTLFKWQEYGNNPGQAFMPPGCKTIEEARKWKYQRFIKDYLACVKSVDDNVGRVLDFLDKNGLADNTIVIYTGDQGFYLGDHGFFDKRFIYEPSFRMPFLMRYPNKIKKGSTNQDLISNVDFAPTLLDFAGIKTPKEVQGMSFAKQAEGQQVKNWRDAVYYHYYEWPFWHHVQPHYGMRTKRYKLVHFYYNIDVWEFYDLEKDPDEMHNAINDPQYADTIAKLKKQLTQLMNEVGDTSGLESFRKITDTDFGKVN